MNLVIVPSAAEAGEFVADRIDEVLTKRSRAAQLGVATGSTPMPVYRALARRSRAGADYRAMHIWALDEYVGLPAGHPASYRTVLDAEFAAPLGLRPDRVHVPSGAAADPARAAADYEARLAEVGGVDLQLLGIGANGHIGFNEPGSSIDSVTRVVELAERTRLDNRRFFDGDLDRVPRRAISQGVATILRARELVLLAFGSEKAEAVAAALEGPIGPECPASFARTVARLTVVLDREATTLLGVETLNRAVELGTVGAR